MDSYDSALSATVLLKLLMLLKLLLLLLLLLKLLKLLKLGGCPRAETSAQHPGAQTSSYTSPSFCTKGNNPGAKARAHD